MRTFSIFLVCAVVGLMPAIALPATFQVTIDQDGFNPQIREIKRGDTVRWVNGGTALHGLTCVPSNIENGSFDSGMLPPGETFERTFKTADTIACNEKSKPEQRGFVFVKGVAISPGDSILIDRRGFDLMIVADGTVDVIYSIYFDGSLIFKGTSTDLGLLVLNNIANLFSTRSGGSVWVFPIPAGVMPLGVHSLRVEVATAAGGLVSYDEATYTVLKHNESMPQ